MNWLRLGCDDVAVVVVTGATGPIGSELARQFSKILPDHSTIVLSSRSKERVNQLKSSIQRETLYTESVVWDLSSPSYEMYLKDLTIATSSVRKYNHQKIKLKRRPPNLAILIHNASDIGDVDQSVIDQGRDVARLNQILNTNVVSAIALTSAFCNLFKSSSTHKVIIDMTTPAANLSFPSFGHISLCKCSRKIFLDTLAMEEDFTKVLHYNPVCVDSESMQKIRDHAKDERVREAFRLIYEDGRVCNVSDVVSYLIATLREDAYESGDVVNYGDFENKSEYDNVSDYYKEGKTNSVGDFNGTDKVTVQDYLEPIEWFKDEFTNKTLSDDENVFGDIKEDGSRQLFQENDTRQLFGQNDTRQLFEKNETRQVYPINEAAQSTEEIKNEKLGRVKVREESVEEYDERIRKYIEASNEEYGEKHKYHDESRKESTKEWDVTIKEQEDISKEQKESNQANETHKMLEKIDNEFLATDKYFNETIKSFNEVAKTFTKRVDSFNETNKDASTKNSNGKPGSITKSHPTNKSIASYSPNLVEYFIGDTTTIKKSYENNFFKPIVPGSSSNSCCSSCSSNSDGETIIKEQSLPPKQSPIPIEKARMMLPKNPPPTFIPSSTQKYLSISPSLSTSNHSSSSSSLSEYPITPTPIKLSKQNGIETLIIGGQTYYSPNYHRTQPDNKLVPVNRSTLKDTFYETSLMESSNKWRNKLDEEGKREDEGSSDFESSLIVENDPTRYLT